MKKYFLTCGTEVLKHCLTPNTLQPPLPETNKNIWILLDSWDFASLIQIQEK